MLQNITGGQIEVTSASLSGDFIGSLVCLEDRPIELGNPSCVYSTVIAPTSILTIDAGGDLKFTGISYSANADGSITITYKDNTGLEKTAIIAGTVTGSGN